MSAFAGLAPEAAVRPDQRDGAGAVPKLRARALAGAEWDAAVADFDTICQEQLHAFAKGRWPGVSLEPRLFEHHGRVVGGALMMVQKLPLGLARIAICKWGPMLADMEGEDAAALHAGMVEALIAEYADARGMMLSILPHAAPGPINEAYLALRRRGFRRGSMLAYPDRYLVDLRLGDAEQRRSFQQGWRRQLNKAEKAGLRFEHAGAERLGDFQALYEAMTDRKQFPDYSAYETLDELMALAPALRPELFFVHHDGEPVAGALIFKAGGRAVYLYGATNDRALGLRAGYFLHWHIIRWLRDHTRARWYDLGGTDGFQGLHQFKKGMVGSAGVIRPVPPVVNYASRPLAYLLGAGAFAARDALLRAKARLDRFNPGKARPDQKPHVPEDYLR